tara:strand:- start:4961 stop:5146 length:186 start_codon:yes stop_codon:yes gene_type:complete
LLALNGCGQKGDLYLPAISPAPNVLKSQSKPESNKEGRPDEAEVLKKNTEKMHNLPSSDSN